MNVVLPGWVDVIVSALLVMSGAFVLISATGLVRLKDFFTRMHPPALAYTGGTWTVTLAGILYFSAIESRVVIKPLIIILLLFITVPVTSLLLARVVLFRNRAAGVEGTPPWLSSQKRDQIES
jgi:multicomponent K+:H+ antiporter subunit G